MDRRNQAPLVDSSACLCRVERSVAGAAAARLMPRAKACVQPSLRASIHPLKPKRSPGRDHRGGAGGGGRQCPLIPGLPDDLAVACLVRVPRGDHWKLRLVCKRWFRLLAGNYFYGLRRRLGLAEQWVYAVKCDGDGRVSWDVLDPARRAWRALPPVPGGVRRRRRVRLRRPRRLPPLPVRRQRPAPGPDAAGGVLQRPEQPVAPGARHAAASARLRMLRDGQPPVRRRRRGLRRRRRPQIGRGVRPSQEPVVFRVRHGCVADAVRQRGARREVVREGAGRAAAGDEPGVLAGDRCVVGGARARRHGHRLEEPERVPRRPPLRRRLQGRLPPARLRRGRRRVERPRRQRAARGELPRGGGGRHGRPPREALRHPERHERLRRRRRRRRKPAVGDRRRQGADQGIRHESPLRHRRRPPPRQEPRPPLPGPRGLATLHTVIDSAALINVQKSEFFSCSLHILLRQVHLN